MKIRPSGKTLWVSLLAFALAVCVALGVFIHSLAPDLEIEGIGGFAPGFDRRLEERLTRAFTLNGLLSSTGRAVRDGDPDGIDWSAPDSEDRTKAPENRARGGDSGGLRRLDGLGRDLAGLGKLMRGVGDIKLKGLQEFDLNIDLEGLDRLKGLDEFARGLDAAFRPRETENPDEGPYADSQRTHPPGSTE